jgi:CDP-diacylglycerol--glycerol-3-phosphate 3-phosphatidyltransferase
MTIPNILTLFRIVLVPVFIFMVYLSAQTGQGHYRYIALGIFLIASITDYLDGYLARNLNQESYIGRILDVTADKLLIMSAVIAFVIFKNLPLNLPLWVAIVILLRDLLVICGVIWVCTKTKKFYVKPNIFGKVGITFEMLMVISILLAFKFSFVIWQIAALLAVISAVIYAFETQQFIREK